MKSKILSSLSVTLGLLISCSSLLAQPGDCPGIVEVIDYGSFDIYYIGDLDPTGSGAGVLWFGVNIEIDFNEPVTIALDFSFDDQPIFSGTTTPVVFTPGIPLTFDNQDFSNQEFDYEGQQIEVEDWDFNEDFLNDVSSSTLASGTYTIMVSLFDDESQRMLCSDFTTLNVTNPDAVWLISPDNGMSVANPTPIFIWSSAAQEFRIRLCRAEEGQYSGEDVMANQPVWEEELFAPTATYPSGDVPALLHGADYYWQVFALVSTTSGEIEFPSEIWSFSYHEEDDYLQEETMQLLQELFPGEAGQILSQLDGYQVSGTIMIDGMPAPALRLEDFLESVRRGEIEIIDMTVE